MKKRFTALLTVLVMVIACFSAYAEVLYQPMNGLEPSGVVPLAGHPRLLMRPEDKAAITANLTKPQNSDAYNKYIETATGYTDGVLENKTAYNQDLSKLAIIESRAFYAYLNNDEESAKISANAIVNFINTLNYDADVNIYHEASHIIFIAAEVYDWCYNYLTSEEKEAIVEAVQNKLLKKFNYGYPFTDLNNKSVFTGATTLFMIIRDTLAFSVAIYDEYPDLFNYLSALIHKSYIEGKEFWYESGKIPSGTGYGTGRHYSDIWFNIIYEKATGIELLSDNVYKTSYDYIYRYNPDKIYYREGDDGWVQTSTVFTSEYHIKPIYTSLMLSSAKLNDKYLKKRALEMSDYIKTLEAHPGYPEQETPWTYGKYQFTAAQHLILNNPDLEGGDISELPPYYYMGYPDGTTIAKTGWDISSQSADATAFMKIGGQQMYDHTHFDFGTFQLFYKGLLMQDIGLYNGTGGAEYSAYNASVISHNGLLVRDSDEIMAKYLIGTLDGVNDGGQQVKRGALGGANYDLDMDSYNKEYFRRAEVLNHSESEKYSYISGDITKAYSDKVSDVKRSMIFTGTGIEGAPAVFMVMDKITATDENFEKAFLFQCLTEPYINGNAITVKRPYVPQYNTFGGELTNQVLYPKKYKFDVIGGRGKQWYVNGVNYTPTGIPNSQNRLDYGWGRIEIISEEKNETDYFLNVMYLNDTGKYEAVQIAELIETEKLLGGKVLNQIVLFGKKNNLNGSVDFSFDGDENYDIVITDLEEGCWNVYKNGILIKENITVEKDNSTIFFNSDGGEFLLKQVSSAKTITENPLFGGGEGTKENPYRIYNKEQFLNIKEENTKHFILMEDINLGKYETPFFFDGILDGNNKEIYAEIILPARNYVGLFSELGLNSCVSDLTVKGLRNGNNYTGGLSGSSAGRIINCKNYASVISENSEAGGITGRYYSGYDRIKECSNYGTVIAKNNYAGGIAGKATSVIIYSYNRGSIKAFGGNAGCISGATTGFVMKCENEGSVYSGGNAGGISGTTLYSMTSPIVFSDCLNSGDVNSETSAGIGGILGYDDAVHTENSPSDVSLVNCINSGGVYIGNKKAKAVNSIFGNHTPGKEIPGISNCYYLSYISENGISGTSSLSSDEINNTSFYADIDFENVWRMDEKSPSVRGVDKLSADCIVINSQEDFNKISDDISGNYILVSSITLSDYSSVENFAGVLDGNGHTITLESGTKTLFITNTASGVIKNLKLSGNAVISGSSRGLLTGYNYGEISDCENNTALTMSGGYNGVFAGENLAGKISFCKNTSDIIFNNSSGGGIAGYSNGQITDCINTGNLKHSTTGAGVIGGIVGGYQTSAPLERCSNSGEIYGGNNAGGIVGQIMASDLKISDCVNSGKIRTPDSGKAAGGISGHITNKTGIRYINCYNTGEIITGNENITAEASIWYDTENSELPVIENCYHPGNGNGKPSSVGLSEEEMKEKTSFVNWDFERVWQISENSYPTLRNTKLSAPVLPVIINIYNNNVSLTAIKLFDYKKVFENYGKYAALLYSQIDSGNNEYILTECGIVLETENKSYKLKADRVDNNMFGELIVYNYGSECELTPYAVYNKNGEVITLYGKAYKAFFVKTIY